MTPVATRQPLSLTHRLRREVIVPVPRPRAIARKRPLELVVELVAGHYNLRIGQLTGRRRSRFITGPRHVAMYMARTLTAASLADIGSVLGRRHYATVLHGIRRIEKRLATDIAFRAEMAALTTLLERGLQALSR